VKPLQTRNFAQRRTPAAWDRVTFFVLFPLTLALWLSVTGISLTSEMSFWHGCLYMTIHCFASWWATALGSGLAARALRGRFYPVWLALMLGWMVTLVPLTYFYNGLPAFFAANYPSLTPVVRGAEFAWTGGYLLDLIRGAVPWLLIWTIVVYGYRFFFGVDWFGPERPVTNEREIASEEIVPDPQASSDRTEDTSLPESATVSGPSAIPDFIRHSELPLDAKIIALKAEEHYVRVWTERGTDLLRYRFRDAVEDMSGQPGLQVHRSWWIRTDCVQEVRKKGRGLQLELTNGLEVPVSVSHRGEILGRMQKSRSRIGRAVDSRPARHQPRPMLEKDTRYI
jgi:hypothetical protein